MTSSPLTGTVTFLFTDIEGSTRCWEQHPTAMRVPSARDALCARDRRHDGGHVFKTMGDVFSPRSAARPTPSPPRWPPSSHLHAEPWGETGPLRVRMALHTGAAEERDGDYFGPPLNRVARLLAAGHGGQILLSQADAGAGARPAAAGVDLRDLGEHRLKDLSGPSGSSSSSRPTCPPSSRRCSTLDARPNNLPRRRTPLIGREQEVAAVRDAAAAPGRAPADADRAGRHRQDPPGLQVAAELLDEFADGVFFVALAPISDPELVAADDRPGARRARSRRPARCWRA